MIQGLLFSALSLLLTFIVADNSFKPTSGELILANQTYQMTWSFAFSSAQCSAISFSLANEDPPSYTTGFSVSSPYYSTMTQTGYQNIYFTEINPTSTTTAITMIYYNADCCGATSFILGPVTVLPNALTQTTPVVTQPATVTVVPTVTVTSNPTTLTKSSTSSSTLVQPSSITSTSLPSQSQSSASPSSANSGAISGPSGSTIAPPENNSASHGLSSGVWAGIGVIVAIITLLVAIATFYYTRKSATDLARTLPYRLGTWHNT